MEQIYKTKNNETRIKPRIFLFSCNNFKRTDRKGEKKMYFLTALADIKLFKNILYEILVSLFYCFVNPFSVEKNVSTTKRSRKMFFS